MVDCIVFKQINFLETLVKSCLPGVQAWLPETDWDPDTRELVRVSHPRAVTIARRLERAVMMNLTAWQATQPIQVRDTLPPGVMTS